MEIYGGRHHLTWDIRTEFSDDSKCMAALNSLPDLIGGVLYARGVFLDKQFKEFLNPGLDGLHSPFLFRDMGPVVDRIKKAIENKEKICIYGDYDADGTTATALLLETFKELRYQVESYIPNRFGEGYGLNKDAIRNLAAESTDLIITVDCGITAVEEVELANSLGMDVIITDHHEPPEGELPPAYGIISPLAYGPEYPFTGLAGVGIAFKLSHALFGGVAYSDFLKKQLDLVALGTIVDVAPLLGENRIMASLGMQIINRRYRPGIRALADVAGFNGTLGSRNISFGLGPRINAAGRISSADSVVRLLTTDDDEIAADVAEHLDSCNKQRKELESQIMEEAIRFIEQDTTNPESHYTKMSSLVVAGHGWHLGVIGIVASRLVERYKKPVFVLSIQGATKCHGSGRSTNGVNLVYCLTQVEDLLTKYGGHESAAGVTLDSKNLFKFGARLDEVVKSQMYSTPVGTMSADKILVDFEATMKDLSVEAVGMLEKLGPFGERNPYPRIMLRDVKIDGFPKLIGAGKDHLKMSITDGKKTMEVVGWRLGNDGPELDDMSAKGVSIDVVVEPEINVWNGRSSVQLSLVDFREKY